MPKNNFYWKAICLASTSLLLCCASQVMAVEPMRYTHPPPESNADVRMNYYWELLQAALEETTPKWGPFQIVVSPAMISAARAELLLDRKSVV